MKSGGAVAFSFNPRVPCGTRLSQGYDFAFDSLVSIHASRAGRDMKAFLISNRFEVSIHASRAGRDLKGERLEITFKVSIHASRAGRDWSEFFCSL